jgi:hypothetical protein
MAWSGLLASLMAVGVLLLPASAANAACERYPTVAEELAEADYVFVAQVTAARMDRTPDDPEGFDGVEYTVRSLQTFKGDPPEDMVLYSENSTARFPMMVTGWYLVFVGPPYVTGFGDRAGQKRAINNCGHSFALNAVPRALEGYPTEMTFEQVMALEPREN